MSSLDEIKVTLASPQSSGQVLAVLHELQQLLRRFTEQGTGGTIDLLSLPFFPGDYQSLKTLLGIGELTIHLNALGPSEIYETAIAGIWWITHRNEAEETIADYIEVTSLPELLKTEASQMHQSAGKLEELIEGFQLDQ
jgi:hydrogenase-1 operon protein HyaF